jgi:hypothetical protein
MSRPLEPVLFSGKSRYRIPLSFILPSLSLLLLVTPRATTLAHNDSFEQPRSARQSSDAAAVIQRDSGLSALEPGKPIERELASPRYAALTQPVPLSLKEIQTQLLDENTLLLEYALGEEKSFVWAVTPPSIKSFGLPKQAEIEAAARRVYDLITASDQIRLNVGDNLVTGPRLPYRANGNRTGNAILKRTGFVIDHRDQP